MDLGDELRRQLGPDLRGRLTVDAEEGGPEVRLDVQPGLAFRISSFRHMGMYDEVLDGVHGAAYDVE